MRWSGILLSLLAFSSIGPDAKVDDPPKADRPKLPDIDRVLEQWQRRMASVSSVDVKFRMTSESKPWDSLRAEGRLVLAAPDFALLEEVSLDKPVKGSGRTTLLWSSESCLFFDYDRHSVSRFRREAGRIGPPRSLAVSLLFQMTADEAKQHFDWEVIGAQGNQVLLGARPRSLRTLEWGPRRFLIWLDQGSYLPVKVATVGEGNRRDTCEILDFKINVPPDDDLRNPCFDSWKVIEHPDWISRLIGL